jgi:hypothetical protein
VSRYRDEIVIGVALVTGDRTLLDGIPLAHVAPPLRPLAKAIQRIGADPCDVYAEVRANGDYRRVADQRARMSCAAEMITLMDLVTRADVFRAPELAQSMREGRP